MIKISLSKEKTYLKDKEEKRQLRKLGKLVRKQKGDL